MGNRDIRKAKEKKPKKTAKRTSLSNIEFTPPPPPVEVVRRKRKEGESREE